MDFVEGIYSTSFYSSVSFQQLELLIFSTVFHLRLFWSGLVRWSVFQIPIPEILATLANAREMNRKK
jgi:hypothetical protein